MSDRITIRCQSLASDIGTSDSDWSTPTCGGRRFRRIFSKREFPILGEDIEDSKAGRRREYVMLSARSRPPSKEASLSVAAVRRWYMDPVTGKWWWPVNGADMVYPGIYLGDA